MTDNLAFPDARTWCDIHGAYEPDQPGDYRSCLECGHVYRTRRELRRRSIAEYPQVTTWRELVAFAWYALTIRAEDIHFCPLCLHDFLPRSVR